MDTGKILEEVKQKRYSFLENIGTFSRAFFLKMVDGDIEDSNRYGEIKEKLTQILSSCNSYHEFGNILRENSLNYISRSCDFEINLNKDNIDKYLSVINSYLGLDSEDKEAA